MTQTDTLLVTKTQILKLLNLSPTQFDSLKTKGVLPKAIGPAKTAKYDLKAVLDGWIAFKMAEVTKHQPENAKDAKTQLTLAQLEWQTIKNEKEKRQLVTQDAALALLNHYITTLRNALTTLEYGWAPELVGLKTEADVMKTLATLRDKMMTQMQDPDDFTIDDFLDDLEAEQEVDDPDAGQ